MSLVSLVSLDAGDGQWRRCGGNRRNVALRRSGPSRCDIATVAGAGSRAGTGRRAGRPGPLLLAGTGGRGRPWPRAPAALTL